MLPLCRNYRRTKNATYIVQLLNKEHPCCTSCSLQKAYDREDGTIPKQDEMKSLPLLEPIDDHRQGNVWFQN